MKKLIIYSHIFFTRNKFLRIFRNSDTRVFNYLKVNVFIVLYYIFLNVVGIM